MDLNQLFANADKDFSKLSKLMATDLDLEKSYETTGSFVADVTTYMPGETVAEPMSISINGDISGIQQKADADLVMDFAINADAALAKMTPEEKAQMGAMLEMFKNISMKIKMDGESGEIYMNSPIFTTLDQNLNADSWLKMNIFETYDKMGIDLRPIMEMNQSQVKMSDLLPIMFMSMENWDVNTYKDIKTGYVFLNNLMGDEAFKSTTAGTITTHTLNIDKTQILAAIAKTALSEGIPANSMNMTDLSSAIEAINLSGNMVIREKAGVLYDYTLKGSGSNEEISLGFDLSGDNLNSLITMDIEQKNMLKMSMKADSKVVVTTKSPDIKLPAGAKVVDYNSYLNIVAPTK